MIKKIVHIADLHIRTYVMHDLYKAQFDKLLEEIKQHSIQWTADGIRWDEIRIVIAGDIAHQKINISNEQLLLTSWFLNQLSGYGKVVIIPGNHDFLENNHERLDSITPVVELLNNKNIVYYKDMGVYEDDNINWVVYSLYQHNARPEFKKNKDKCYIGLFHGAIQGMSTDLGFKFEDGYDRLNFINLDLLLCGDIHKRQVFAIPNEKKAYMVGSTVQQNFGETVRKHGFGIYDVEEDKYEFVDLENPKPFLSFKITSIDDLVNGTEKLLNY